MSRSHIGAKLAIACALTLVTPATLIGQPNSRFFPSHEYMPKLLAAPHAPVSAAKLVFNADGPHEFGNTVDGEVALGTSLPLYLVAGDNLQNGLVLGVEGAVFGRFTLTTITRDLIATDWIFAIPLTLHLGGHWLRLRYHHKSSHIGDEYIARFGAHVGDYSRDAADFTAFYKATESLGFYTGGNWAFNVHPDGARRGLLRTGMEVEARTKRESVQPYGAVDVVWEQNNDWEPRMNIQLGLWLPAVRKRRLIRFAAEFLAGPSAQGQFRHERVRHFSVGFYITP